MKVMIVDDDETAAEMLADYMELSGFETDSARNGQEAMDKLRTGKFQCVITDGYMPYMNGFELCRFIKANCPDTYTVGITDSLHLDRFREAGADDCFCKPVDCFMLCSRVRDRLAEAHESGLTCCTPIF